ncbi:MAG: helix-hairpin-helix domain-containing protein [Burkholderiaceae bacterium]|nr:helix-hairpin-helix domain-containing protein [Burkholderiaceae bacterium]
MFKKLLAFFAAMSLVAAFAAVDVNKATEAELDGIKGIGPVTTKLIISERKKGEFKNWDDFVTRVKGVGDKSAAQFSAGGLTVAGASYQGPSTAPAKKTDKSITQKTKDAAVATKDAVKGAAVSTKDAVKDTAKDVKAAVSPKPDAAKPAASAPKK